MKRWLDILIPGCLLVIAVALRLYEGPVTTEIRNLVFDTYQRIEPRTYIAQPVRIVDIDEESLKRLGQWPWPRNLVAELVDRLSAAGAAAVALDVIFAEPDRTAPANLLALWRDRPEYEALRSSLAALPDPDAELAAALGRSNAVTAFVLLSDADDRRPALKAGFAYAGDDPLQFVPAFRGAATALPALEAAAAGNGSVNASPDSDGTIRRVPLLASLDEQLYPSLAAEALRVAQGAGSYTIKASGASGEMAFGESTGINHVRIGAAVVPTDPGGNVLLYDTGSQAARFLPAWRLFDPEFDPAPVAGHIVLVGTSVEGLKDVRSTPLDPVMAGVEVHAQVIEQIVGQTYLKRPDWAAGAELLYLVALGGVLIVALGRVGALASAITGGVSTLATILLSWLAFSQRGWLLDPFYPSFAALFIYLAGVLLGYLRTEREKRYVRGAFGRYLSPVLVEQLTRHPERLALGGEMRELTLLFCDIRGFTRISERLDPQALTGLINGFLTPMTSIIQNASGTIDKYIGDCIMAFWNAPLDDPNHGENAVRGALRMREELARLNEGWRAADERAGREHLPIAIGIGLNTGRCCVGNMGSEQRFDYSVLGDAVNVASRLESLSRVYGVDIVLGADTAAAAAAMALVEIDQVQVKGRATPLGIFTALGDETARATPDFQALAPRHASMIAAYRRQDWEEARRAIADCRSLQPTLGLLYDLYESRIAEYVAVPPPANWDGIFVPTTKTG